MPERLLTIDEAADYLRYTKKYMYKLVAEKQITCVRIGPNRTALRFTQEDLRDYVNQAKVKSDAELMSKAAEILRQGE